MSLVSPLMCVVITTILIFSMSVSAMTITSSSSSHALASRRSSLSVATVASDVSKQVADVSGSTLHVLFLHGSGEEGDLTSAFIQESAAWTVTYWGKVGSAIRARMPSGTTLVTSYLKTNTRQRGWTDKDLPTQYCAAIQTKNPDIVVTHSMAGLIIAAGIKANLPGCNKIGTTKDKILWIASAAPFAGTIAADHAGTLCAKTGRGTDGIVKLIKMAFGNPCQVEGREVSDNMALDGSKLSTNALSLTTPVCTAAKLKETALQYVSASACGVSANLLDWAMNTAQRTQPHIHAALAVASVLPGWKGAANDGLVNYDSCALSGKSYTSDPTSKWYMCECDHADLSFRNDADGTKSASMPTAWIVNQVISLYTSLKK